jgi:hypothetical protein
MALRLAVKLTPEALLEMRVSAPPLEMVGGPGQVPPVPTNPPERSSVEPSVTHTAVSYSVGCHGALTVPLAHGTLVGVVATSAGALVVEEPGGSVEVAVLDEVLHPAMNRPATIARASRLIDTAPT